MEQEKSDENVKLQETFPTGKQHVSFSEISCWMECSKKHEIKYIKHVDMFVPTPYVKFGSIVHSTCEKFLKTHEMDISSGIKELQDEWKLMNFSELDMWIESLENIVNEFPGFMDKTFPGWELVAAEEQLFEPISGHDISFKGYVDSVIKTTQKNGNPIYWIIDYKTCGWGWPAAKKRSFEVQLQLMLYKNYWSKKHGVDKKDIRCAFALMKRNKKVQERIDLVTISVGDKSLEKALSIVSKMVTSVKRRIFVMNRDVCNRCEFFMTEHCSSV